MSPTRHWKNSQFSLRALASLLVGRGRGGRQLCAGYLTRSTTEEIAVYEGESVFEYQRYGLGAAERLDHRYAGGQEFSERRGPKRRRPLSRTLTVVETHKLKS